MLLRPGHPLQLIIQPNHLGVSEKGGSPFQVGRWFNCVKSPAFSPWVSPFETHHPPAGHLEQGGQPREAGAAPVRQPKFEAWRGENNEVSVKSFGTLEFETAVRWKNYEVL